MLDKAYSLKLSAYFFAAESFNTGKNIFKSFLPILDSLLATCERKTISFLKLQQLINDTFDVNIPKATLRQLITDLESQGKVSFERGQTVHINFDQYGENYWEEKEKKESFIDNLFYSFREFLINKEKKLPINDVREMICNYIFTHSNDLVGFIGGVKSITYTGDDDYISDLCEYLIEERETKSDNYKAFLSVYEGAIQASLLNFNPEKIDDVQMNELDIQNVILDSNFIMRVLDIQTEIEGSMAKDTYRILKENGSTLMVLESSLKEIRNSLNNFLTESQGYTTHTSQYYRHHSIKTSGIWSATQRGVSRKDLLELSKIRFLTDKLTSLGITVINDVDVPEFPQDEIDSLIMAKNKDSYGKPQAIHDLHLIDYCRKRRPNKVNSFNSAKWWVLTNDIRLTYWNQNNKKFDVQECITEAQLSNLLWIKAKKDSNEGLANTMVALANNKLVSLREINTFHQKMLQYSEAVKDDNKQLDLISIVFATDSLKSEDIRRVNANEVEIAQLIAEKAKEIEQQKHVQEQEYTKLQTESTQLKQELEKKEKTANTLHDVLRESNNDVALLKLETDKLELDKNILTLEAEKADISRTIRDLKNRELYKDRITSTSAWKVLFIFVVIFVAIALILALIICSFIDPIRNFMKKMNLPNNLYATIIGIAWALFTGILVFVITVICAGEPMKISELFILYRNKKVDIQMKRYDKNQLPSDLLETNISKLKEKLHDCEIQIDKKKDERQDVSLNIRKLETNQTTLIEK